MTRSIGSLNEAADKSKSNSLSSRLVEWSALTSLIATAMLVTVGPQQSLALRTGAPAMSCLNMRPMHGLNRPKPASASQFFIRQSSLSYLPGEIIEVDLMTYSDQRHFRGFLIQAQDPHTGHHVGHFAPTKESRPIDSCSAATHRDASDKQRVKLVWLSPGASLPPGTDLGAPTHTSAWRNPIQPSINLSLLHKRQLVSVTTNVTHITSSPTSPPALGDTPPASPPPPQVEAAATPDTPPQAGPPPSSPAPPTSAPGPAPVAPLPLALAQPAFAPVKRQVRFRATIVVSYDDFYTGFESSDLRYDAFSFANGTSTSASK